MSGNDTDGTRAGLPMLITLPAPRPGLQRATARAAFVSQLIAARQHLAPQRARRRAPVAEAVNAYATSGRATVRRIPAGYRRTVVA